VELSERWWTAFGSPELNALIERALAGNMSLSRAAARLEQARAGAALRGAARRPELSVSGSVSVNERERAQTPGADTRTESAGITLAAGYELDLWGRLTAIAREAELDRDASSEDLQAARVSVTAETALRYFELLGVRRKLHVVIDQLETSRSVAGLVELRFRRSQASALDVLQQRENVAAVEALLPHLEARESVLLNELAVLTGVPAGTRLALTARSLPAVPPLPEAGVPARLLARRPDVRAARLRLESSEWSVSAAQADRLPAVRITSSGGYSAGEISDLFDNWIAQLAAGLAGPLLDGGRRKAEVARAMAVVDERLSAYRSVLLEAVREVEDALVLDRRQGEHVAALERQLEAARLSRSEATARYQRGIESYLSVLLALGGVQRLERQIADARLERIAYRVNLYRALAGAWEE
jgi:NodT family efflux transporter outer membrane factor (OMF) lipoprotein